MIREYAPIGLIPAAWAMTFATMIYPGIDTYWIQHMHYFMIVFLAGFTVLSWKQMGEDSVLDIWRKVIAAGVVFTVLGAISFSTRPYTQILAFSSLAYWFLAPALALYQSSKYMDSYSDLYEELGVASVIAFGIFILGIHSGFISLQILGLISVALAQTASILVASKLDM